jgi:hypothetical protein
MFAFEWKWLLRLERHFAYWYDSTSAINKFQMMNLNLMGSKPLNDHGPRQHAWVYFTTLTSLDNSFKSNTPSIIFWDLYASSSIFYTNPICIILSGIHLTISHEWNNSLALALHKRTRLMGYKYHRNPSSFKFKISSFSIFLAYIFLESIFIKYHCTFSF